MAASITIRALLTRLDDERCERYPHGLNVLSLDWDAWTGDCLQQDACCGWCSGQKSFRGETRPNAKVGARGEFADGVWEESNDMWHRPMFPFKSVGDPVALIVAECHADMIHVTRACDIVTLVDAHEDNSQPDNGHACHTWGSVHQDLKMVDIEREHICGKFDVIFLCLSSPWTPQRADGKFFHLAHYLGLKTWHEPVFFGHRKDWLKEEYERRWCKKKLRRCG